MVMNTCSDDGLCAPVVLSVGMDTGQFALKISQFSFDPLVVVRTFVYDSKVCEGGRCEGGVEKGEGRCEGGVEKGDVRVEWRRGM